MGRDRVVIVVRLLVAALALWTAPVAAQEEPTTWQENSAGAREQAPAWQGTVRAESTIPLLTGQVKGVSAVQFSFTVGADGTLSGSGFGSFVFGGAYEEQATTEEAGTDEAAAAPLPAAPATDPSRCLLSAVGARVPVAVQGHSQDEHFVIELVPELTPIDLSTTCPGPNGPITTTTSLLIPLPTIGPVELPAFDGATWSGELAAGDGPSTTLDVEIRAPTPQAGE